MRSIWFWLVGRTGTNLLARWLHPRAYRLTGGAGLVGRSLGNLTIVMTTIGRQSGKPRTTAIWAYPDGESLVVVGSFGGRRRAPGWVHNLRALPEATVQLGRIVRTMRSHEAAGEEYERLWKLVVAAYPGYEAYLRWAHRVIPLVVLDPVPAGRA